MSGDDFPVSKKAFNLALAFHNSADKLVDWLKSTYDGQRTPPEACAVVVNYSFAAELYLKSILYKENGEKKARMLGHKLSDLFERMSDPSKAALRHQRAPFKWDCKELEREEFSIEHTLTQYESAFVEYRYLFEDKNKGVSGSIEGIMKACDILKVVSKSIVFV